MERKESLNFNLIKPGFDENHNLVFFIDAYNLYMVYYSSYDSAILPSQDVSHMV